MSNSPILDSTGAIIMIITITSLLCSCSLDRYKRYKEPMMRIRRVEEKRIEKFKNGILTMERIFLGIAALNTALLLGGILFSAMELGEEEKRHKRYVDFLSNLKQSNISDSLLAQLEEYLPAESKFKQWGNSQYFFAFTVLSTIGYGNLAPSTPAGRLFATAYNIFAMPIGLAVFAMFANNILVLIIKTMSRKHDSVDAVFHKYDHDRSGTLSRSELEHVMADLKIKISANELTAVLEDKRMQAPNGELSLAGLRHFIKHLQLDLSIISQSRLRIIVSLSLFFGWTVLGTIAFKIIYPSWTVVDAFYFSVVTLTSTGLGDFHPKTGIGEIICIIYFCVGYGFVILSFTAMGSLLLAMQDKMKYIAKKTQKRMARRISGAGPRVSPVAGQARVTGRSNEAQPIVSVASDDFENSMRLSTTALGVNTGSSSDESDIADLQVTDSDVEKAKAAEIREESKPGESK